MNLSHPLWLGSFEEAKAKLFDYIEIFYNRQRLHSSLGYRTPVEQDGLAGA